VFWWQLSLTTSDRMCQVWVWPTSGRVPDVWCCPPPPMERRPSASGPPWTGSPAVCGGPNCRS